jgi:hypothetical protein
MSKFWVLQAPAITFLCFMLKVSTNHGFLADGPSKVITSNHCRRHYLTMTSNNSNRSSISSGDNSYGGTNGRRRSLIISITTAMTASIMPIFNLSPVSFAAIAATTTTMPSIDVNNALAREFTSFPG